MRNFGFRRKFDIPQNTNDTMALIAWIIQIFGTLLLYLLLTAGYVIGAYFFCQACNPVTLLAYDNTRCRICRN